MPKRVALPVELKARAFSVARAAEFGVGRGRLRGREFEHPFHGVRVVRAADRTAIDAYAPRLRVGECFSHESAARLWLAPLAYDSPRPGDLVHVTIAAPAGQARGRGVAGHRTRDGSVHVVHRFGLATVDAATMWLQLAHTLPLAEVVAIGDHLILSPEVLDPLDIRPYVTLAELHARTQTHPGRGKLHALEALTLMREGAESRPETLLRLLLQRAGLPEPEVNPIIRDSRNSRIGRADLVYRDARVIVEYDGDQHRTNKAQYEKDQVRFELFTEANWKVLRFRKPQLFDRPAATVEKVRKTLAARSRPARSLLAASSERESTETRA